MPNYTDQRKRYTKEQARVFGARLRRLREAAGLSQRQLATRTTFTAAYISRIENGDRYPSVEVMRELAAPLGVTTEYLEYGRDRSVADDLAERLSGQTDGLNCIEFGDPDAAVVVHFEYDGVPRKGTGECLTEALRAAVDWVVEVERLRRAVDEHLAGTEQARETLDERLRA